MEPIGRERRNTAPPGTRPPFGELVRIAVRLRIRDTRAEDAVWTSSPNLAWVRLPREDGRQLYYAVRRRLDWLTAEIGASPGPMDLEELSLIQSLDDLRVDGCRIQLGPLLHGQDRWWSTGGSAKTLSERLDWLALQMQLGMNSLLLTLSKRVA